MKKLISGILLVLLCTSPLIYANDRIEKEHINTLFELQEKSQRIVLYAEQRLASNIESFKVLRKTLNDANLISTKLLYGDPTIGLPPLVGKSKTRDYNQRASLEAIVKH